MAEGSTGETDAERGRFLGMAIRSLLETVACQHLSSRRGYVQDASPLRQAYRSAEVLAAKLHVMRKAISQEQPWLREDRPVYDIDVERS